jgi:hypothetical protein
VFAGEQDLAEILIFFSQFLDISNKACHFLPPGLVAFSG